MASVSDVSAGSGPLAKLKQFRSDMAPGQWLQTKLMFASIVLLHVIGFGVFIVFVVPDHYKGLGIGVSVLAYTLGLRHAFDADHISAIDNTTRKLMNEGKRAGQRRATSSRSATRPSWSPSGPGSWSPRRTVYAAVSNNGSGLEQFGGVFGTVVSASFLYLIAFLNIVILAGIIAVFRTMRHGDFDEAELERQLENRGLMYRFFGKWMKIDHQGVADVPGGRGLRPGLRHRHRGRPAGHHRPAGHPGRCRGTRSCACPILFTAGMGLMDTARRRLHERGLRLGLLQPGPQGLLQPGHHRAVGVHLLLHRHDRGARPAPDGAAPHTAASGTSWRTSTSTPPAS